MNLTKFYENIVSKESYRDLERFFDEVDSFEEMPLISRDCRTEELQKMLNENDASEFLLGFSYFILNTLRLISHTKKIKQGLIAITFMNFDKEEYGPTLIPRLFVYPDEAGQALYENLIKNQQARTSTEMKRTKDLFKKCNLLEQFTFVESRWFDKACNEELIRIFAIPKQP